MPIRTPILALAATVALSTGAVAQTTIGWTDNAERWRGQNGETISLVCPPRNGAQISGIWGTDIYTDDSSICGAAVHAGAITEVGGAVTIEIMPGQDAYQGTTRNGIETNPYPGWFGSFRFVAAGGQATPPPKPTAAPAQPAAPPGNAVAVPDGPTAVVAADARCVDRLTAGVGLNEVRVQIIIDTYPAIRAALAAIPGIDVTVPAGAVPAFLCMARTAALDAAVAASNFDFDIWASLFTTVLVAHIFAEADPADAAALAETIGVTPPSAHVALVRQFGGTLAAMLTAGGDAAAAPAAGAPVRVAAAAETTAFAACRNAADYRVNGVGVDPNQLDAATAIGLCQAAVAELPDDPRALALLARALGSAGRYDEALAAARTAADAGDAAGQAVLGAIYLFGQGVPQDLAEAVRLFRLAAEQGHPAGQNNLGTLYADGQGVPQDWAEAVRWYRLAAEQGMGVAMFNLGTRYLLGEGVPEDPVEAARWFRLGAEQGNGGAQGTLALLHVRGEGVAQDYAEAARLFRLSAEQGFDAAQNGLGVLYQVGEGVPQDYGEAVRWFGLAVAQGNTLAMVNLGAHYELGLGVALDLAEAERLYRLAVAGGNTDAQEHVDRVVALRAAPQPGPAPKGPPDGVPPAGGAAAADPLPDGRVIGWRDSAGYLAAGAPVGQRFAYVCPPWTTGSIPPTIRGTDIYSADSYICGAAVHAGVITTAGGAVTIEVMAGQDAYVGTERNGVRSRDFGAYASSFRFVTAPAMRRRSKWMPGSVSRRLEAPLRRQAWGRALSCR